MTASWKSKAAIIAAAIAGGLLSLHVHSFHQFHPTPVGLLVAYTFGALVCGIGMWGLLVVVGLVRDTAADVKAMADPAPQNPIWWVEPRPSQEVDR